MEMKTLYRVKGNGEYSIFNYKGKWSKRAVYRAAYGAGFDTLSELIGCRRAKVLRKALVPRKWGLI